ncbi:sulfur carrier protein ThiS [Nocardioides sp.]|uniref:sulfur carrier protein ThiS n=1 Tax=Nocardioides sp. TaxID=35761 RepID=UPI003517537A
MTSSVTITCNGERLALPATDPALTVADLLALRRGDPRPHGVAVAVDDEVVPRADWSRHRLADGAVVEIVTAVQGG